MNRALRLDLFFLYGITALAYHFYGFNIAIIVALLLFCTGFLIGSAENNSYLYKINSNLDKINKTLRDIRKALRYIRDNLESKSDQEN